MGKFAENLNLGKRILPPPPGSAVYGREHWAYFADYLFINTFTKCNTVVLKQIVRETEKRH